MTCSPSSARDFCPTADDLAPAYLALLPRGRAWAEGGDGRMPGGVIFGWVYALAARMAAVHAEICALAREFFCATTTTARDLWLAEYGLPDGCDPYPDLCLKVAALGGVTCDFYQAIAGRLGWSIDCARTTCSVPAGAMRAGCGVPGLTFSPSVLMVRVSLDDSPAYTGLASSQARVAGLGRAGQPYRCGPDLTGLDCILQRIVHAHVRILYLIA